MFHRFFLFLFFSIGLFQCGCQTPPPTQCLTDYNCPASEFCVHRRCTTKRPSEPLPTDRSKAEPSPEPASQKDAGTKDSIVTQNPDKTGREQTKETLKETSNGNDAYEPQKEYKESQPDSGREVTPEPDRSKPSVGQCSLSFQPGRVDFGVVGTGLTKQAFVAVSNDGGDCVVQQLTVPKSGSSIAFRILNSPSTPFVLKAGGQFQAELQFIPLTPFSKTWNNRFEVHTNNSVSPVFSITLVGKSETLKLAVFPRQLDFGEVTVGCQRTLKFKLFTRLDSVKVKLSKLTILPSNSMFSVAGSTVLPLSLKFGVAGVVEVTFKPLQAKTWSGTLRLFLNQDSRPFLELPLRGQGTTSLARTEIFQQPQTPKADILLVLDFTSPTMKKALSELVKWLPELVSTGDRLKAKYHIGVIASTPSVRGGSAACLMGRIRYISPNVLQGSKVLLSNFPVTNAWNYPVQPPDMMFQALSVPKTLKGQCNEGFLRKDATLSVLFFTTKEDQGKWSEDFTLSFVKALKGRQSFDMVRLSAIAGPPGKCFNKKLSISASSTPKLWSLAGKTKGLQLPVCDLSKGYIQKLATLSYRLRQSFGLMESPRLGSLEIFANGKKMTSGWKWDLAERAIVFEPNAIPGPGSVLMVKYRSSCTP